MHLEEQLEQLGLKTNEARIYLAVLELGEPTVGNVERLTSLHRQVIYNAVGALQQRGLVSVREIRGRKRFTVADPGVLEEHARSQLDRAREILPQLFARANQQRSTEKVRTYRGSHAIHQYYWTSIRRQPEKSTVAILGVNSARYFELFEPGGIPYRRFEQARVDRSVQLRLLLAGAIEDEVRWNARRPRLELRLLTVGIQGPMDLMIWHNHIGILFYGTEPYAIDIIGPETVAGFQQYFDLLWSQGKPISLA